MNRFDYLKYDEAHQKKSNDLRELFVTLEHAIETMLPDGRSKSLALTHVEESFMWCGKAVRDSQHKVNVENAKECSDVASV